jgi:hypothetical protein
MLRMLNAHVGIQERERKGEEKTPSYNLPVYAFNNHNNWCETPRTVPDRTAPQDRGERARAHTRNRPYHALANNRRINAMEARHGG